MTTINKSFKSLTGKEITVSLVIDNSAVTGNATTNGTVYSVTGTAVIQNRKCLKIEGASAPYLPIADGLYNEIETICKAQFLTVMTPKELLEVEVDKAEYEYERLNNSNVSSNIEIIEAREKFFTLRREYLNTK